MTPERSQQIEQLCQEALDLEPTARTAFLDRACEGDEALRREIESLLKYSEEEVNQFIKQPAAEVVAKALAKKELLSMVGKTIGHYKILSSIGAGGMAVVWLAQDTNLPRNVALKILSAEFTKDQDQVHRFTQEAKAASALNHPNIITIYEIGEADGIHYIAMEFIEGQTLRQKMMTRLKLDEALKIVREVANALDAVHAKSILHRDIKPENIMVRPDGLVKVLDFGLAKLLERPKVADDDDMSSVNGVLTERGVVMGTVNYMSPEQVRGDEIDTRTDIFSLGVLLYEMITGSAPFAGKTSMDVWAAILVKEPKSLDQYLPTVPNSLKWIVTKALGKDFTDRYHDIKDLLLDLKLLQQELKPEAERQGPPKLDHSGAATQSDRQGQAASAQQVVSTAAPSPAVDTDSTTARKPGKIKYLKWVTVIFVMALMLLTAGIWYKANSNVPVWMPAPFELTDYHVTIDVTGWKKVSETQKNEKIWSEITTTRMKMRRLIAGWKDFTHIVGTARNGPEPSFACISGQNLFPPHAISDHVMENYKSWLLVIDLSQEPVGADFDLQYTETFWNSFPGETREWAAVLVSYPTRKLTIEILFPEDKAARNFSYTYSPYTADPARETYSNPRVQTTPKGESRVTQLTWEISNPSVGKFYRVDWNW